MTRGSNVSPPGANNPMESKEPWDTESSQASLVSVFLGGEGLTICHERFKPVKAAEPQSPFLPLDLASELEGVQTRVPRSRSGFVFRRDFPGGQHARVRGLRCSIHPQTAWACGYSVHVQKRCIPAIEECQHNVVEDVFQPLAPEHSQPFFFATELVTVP